MAYMYGMGPQNTGVMGPPVPPELASDFVGPTLPSMQRGMLATRAGAPPVPGGTPGIIDDTEIAKMMYRRQAAETLQTPPAKTSKLDRALGVLGPVIAGIATGGAALPAALGYAIASDTHGQMVEKATQREWERQRFGLAGDAYSAAAEMDVLNAGYNKQLKTGINPATGKEEYFEYNPRAPGGQRWIGVEVEQDDKTHTPGELGKAAYDMFAKPYHELDEQQKKAVDDFLQTSTVRTALEMMRNPNVAAGVGLESEVKTEGKEGVERQYALRAVRDDIELNVLPMLDETSDSAARMLERIQSGEGTFSFPVVGAFLSNILPDLSEMQQYAAGEALQNLQITNLAPVTEKEIEFIQTMAANPSAWNDAVNVRRLEGTLRKIANHKEKAHRQMRYIAKELGEDIAPEYAAPVEPTAEPEPFDPEAFLDGLP